MGTITMFLFAVAGFIGIFSSLASQRSKIKDYEEALKNVEQRDEINNEVNKMDNDRINSGLSDWMQSNNGKK